MMPIPSPPPRLAEVDALRGFALLGILVVNIGVFASSYYGSGMPDPVFDRPLDRAVQLAVALLFETKFYLLFSFLFGYSFTLQIDSAQRAGRAFVPRFCRRLAGLALLGLLLALLLYVGDILLLYALLGLLLLAWRNWTPAGAVRFGVACIIVSGLVWGALGGLMLVFGDGVDPALVQQQAGQALAAYRGTPATIIAWRWQDLTGVVWPGLVLLQAPGTLAMFLFGLAAGRRRLLADGARQMPAGRLVAIGLPLGLAGAVVYAYAAVFCRASALGVLGMAVGLLSAPLLTGAYVGLALRGFRSAAGGALAAALAPAGRMALSNYLLQSLVCALLFTGYGLGLIGRLAPWQTLLIALALFAIQLRVSAWWLTRHGYGPAEWLLRAVTHAAWPRWRRD